MFFPALLIVAGWALCGSVSASPAVEAAYAAVLSVVSPGQPYLTGDSLHTVFNTLENRVQCGEVSCEKVSFIMLSAAARWNRQVAYRRWRRGVEVHQATLISEFLKRKCLNVEGLKCQKVCRHVLHCLYCTRGQFIVIFFWTVFTVLWSWSN